MDSIKTIYIDDREPSLAEMQGVVGGLIEVIYPNPKTQIIINEEGKLRDLPINTEATLVWKNNGNYYGDVIMGNAIILTKEALLK